MKKPWSISTTVRNPERLKGLLGVLKELEGEIFDEETQKKFQILLIQRRLYKPTYIRTELEEYYEKPDLTIPYEKAELLFKDQDYETPAMRGRQSANPLNKMGFSIARKGAGPIVITELGNMLLREEYEPGYVFFKTFLKLQFPNPWVKGFSEREGFNIVPFIATMQLIKRVNELTGERGITKDEFCIFGPTLINANDIDRYATLIAESRRAKSKRHYQREFAKKFFETEKGIDKKINNLYDYGDNAIRYFRLTKYLKTIRDPLGKWCKIDLERARGAEINQLLERFAGKAMAFSDLKDYLNYITDINQPPLPWEDKKNLVEIGSHLKGIIQELVQESGIRLSEDEEYLIRKDFNTLNKVELEKYVSEIRLLHVKLKESIKKIRLNAELPEKGREMLQIFRSPKRLRKYEPEEFEKITTEVLQIIDDEILIKPNYPKDDDGDPINHAPGNKPDIECYYENFKATCEVTLNVGSLQWVQEGQPVMRHLRDFEKAEKNGDVFCLFIAPRIHNDTYSQFWISVKYEYDGAAQRIVPLTTEQFSVIIETLLTIEEKGKKLPHEKLLGLYHEIIEITKNAAGFSEWKDLIPDVLANWQNRIINA